MPLADIGVDNPLQIAVLNLFVNLKSRFPNLVVGAITRESVKKALLNGITADQVSLRHSSTPEHRYLCGAADYQLSDDARPPTNAQERTSPPVS